MYFTIDTGTSILTIKSIADHIQDKVVSSGYLQEGDGNGEGVYLSTGFKVPDLIFVGLGIVGLTTSTGALILTPAVATIPGTAYIGADVIATYGFKKKRGINEVIDAQFDHPIILEWQAKDDCDSEMVNRPSLNSYIQENCSKRRMV